MTRKHFANDNRFDYRIKQVRSKRIETWCLGSVTRTIEEVTHMVTLTDSTRFMDQGKFPWFTEGPVISLPQGKERKTTAPKNPSSIRVTTLTATFLKRRSKWEMRLGKIVMKLEGESICFSVSVSKEGLGGSACEEDTADDEGNPHSLSDSGDFPSAGKGDPNKSQSCNCRLRLRSGFRFMLKSGERIVNSGLDPPPVSQFPGRLAESSQGNR